MTNVKISADYLEFINSGTNYGRITGTSDGLITLTSNSGNVRIAGLTNPTGAQDAATKDYVDTVVSPSFFRVIGNGAQTITANILTRIDVTDTFNGTQTTRGDNPPTIASTGIVTINETGYYNIVVHLYVIGNVSGPTIFNTYTYINGSNYEVTRVNFDTGNFWGPGITSIAYLEQGDTVEVYCLSNRNVGTNNLNVSTLTVSRYL